MAIHLGPVIQYMPDMNCRRMSVIAPRGDLESKLHGWVDINRASTRGQEDSWHHCKDPSLMAIQFLETHHCYNWLIIYLPWRWGSREAHRMGKSLGHWRHVEFIVFVMIGPIVLAVGHGAAVVVLTCTAGIVWRFFAPWKLCRTRARWWSMRFSQRNSIQLKLRCVSVVALLSCSLVQR